MKKRSPLRIALLYVSKQKARLAAAVFWQGVYEVAPMQVPLLTGAIVDGLTRENVSLYGLAWHAADPMDVLQMAVFGLLAVALAYGYSSYARTVASAKLSHNFVSTVRKAVLEKIALLSLDLHQQYGTGELLDRALSDTNQTRQFMERVFIQTVTNFLRAGYPIIMLVLIDPLLAAIALSVLPPQWLVSWYLQRRLHAATRKTRESSSDLTTAVKENLDGIETIKTLNAETTLLARMQQKTEHLEADQLYASRISALNTGTVWLTTSVGVALTWWHGGLRVIEGEMTLGLLVVFTGFVTFAYRPFRQFTNIANRYRRGLVSLERIQDLLDVPSTVWVSPSAQAIRITDGRIELRRVSFAYRQQAVLKDVNLKIEPRHLTAIVGRSGSGKTSLLRLITRLYDPDQGLVLIDGQAIKHATLDSLCAQIAVVPQQPMLFSGTVLENIRIGRPDALREEVMAACEACSALTFVERLEHGFETRLGRQGASLSGGEVQRIAIARALLSRPKILLMDEPTSGLDAESESAVVETLLRLRKEMTVVLVGHHVNTVWHADRIIVMDAGRVVEEGTHEVLLTQSLVYNELFGTGTGADGEPVHYIAKSQARV